MWHVALRENIYIQRHQTISVDLELINQRSKGNDNASMEYLKLGMFWKKSIFKKKLEKNCLSLSCASCKMDRDWWYNTADGTVHGYPDFT